MDLYASCCLLYMAIICACLATDVSAEHAVQEVRRKAISDWVAVEVAECKFPQPRCAFIVWLGLCGPRVLPFAAEFATPNLVSAILNCTGFRDSVWVPTTFQFRWSAV